MPTMPPIHRGEILLDEFLEPLCISQLVKSEKLAVMWCELLDEALIMRH